MGVLLNVDPNVAQLVEEDGEGNALGEERRV
jgi:hypothetical protein